MESILYKKQSRGITGMHIWHRRYFVYREKDKTVYYYDDKPTTGTSGTEGPAPRGNILLSAVESVRWFKNKKKGRRFDVSVALEKEESEDDSVSESSVSGTRNAKTKVYALLALKRSVAKEWVQVLTGALNAQRKKEESKKLRGRLSFFSRDMHGNRRIFRKKSPLKPLRAKNRPQSMDLTFLHRKQSIEKSYSRDSTSSLGEEIVGRLVNNVSSSRRCPILTHREALKWFPAGHPTLLSDGKMDARPSFKLIINLKQTFRLNRVKYTDDIVLERDEVEYSVSKSNLARTPSRSLTGIDFSYSFSMEDGEEHITQTGTDSEGETKTEYERTISGDLLTVTPASTSAVKVTSPVKHHRSVSAFLTSDQKKYADFSLESLHSDVEAMNPPPRKSDAQRSSLSSKRPEIIRTVFRKLVREGPEDRRGRLDKRSVQYRYETFEDSFTGNAIVSWLLSHKKSESIAQASDIANSMISKGFIVSVDENRRIPLGNSEDLFRFTTKLEKKILYGLNRDFMEDLAVWVHLMRSPSEGIQPKTLKKGLRTYHNRFTFADMFQWLLLNNVVVLREDALYLCNCLLAQNVILSVDDVLRIKEDEQILKFSEDLEDYETERRVRKLCADVNFVHYASGIVTDRQLLKIVLEQSAATQEMAAEDYPRVLTEFLVRFTSDFAKKLTCVFTSDDTETHALALETYWEILKQQSLKSHLCTSTLECPECQRVEGKLEDFIQSFCSGKRFSFPVKTSLFSMLILDSWSAEKPVPFNQSVVRPGLWKTLFMAMKGSASSVRLDVWKDVLSLLAENPTNALDISAQKEWGSWFVPFTFRVFDDFVLNCEYAITTVSIILFHLFGNSTLFARHVSALLLAFQTHGKPAESVANAQKTLETLVSKVAEHAALFTESPEKDSILWNNLFHALDAIITFVFCSDVWGEARDSSTEQGLQHGLHRINGSYSTALSLIEKCGHVLSCNVVKSHTQSPQRGGNKVCGRWVG